MSEDPWPDLGTWWLEEMDADPAYREEIEPMLLRLLEPSADNRYLDVGCGDGRIMATLRDQGCGVVGCDLNQDLLAIARKVGPVVRVRLPTLGCLRPGSFDGAMVGLVLEHLEHEVEFFAGLATVVRAGGALAVVINHPIWTAPGSTPIEDVRGEMLWRSGAYFGRGFSDEPAGQKTVRFHHRTMADLLNAASRAGWDLQRMDEAGISARQMVRYPEYAGQEHIPRLLGVRWDRR